MHHHSSFVAAAVAALVTACGGGSSSTAPSSMHPAPPGSASVTITDFAFAPKTLTIKAGTTVVWTNHGPSAHTTVSDASGLWNSGTLSPPIGSGGSYGAGSGAGGQFQFTFDTPGTYTYHCAIHPPSLYPAFTGTIVVTR